MITEGAVNNWVDVDFFPLILFKREENQAKKMRLLEEKERQKLEQKKRKL